MKTKIMVLEVGSGKPWYQTTLEAFADAHPNIKVGAQEWFAFNEGRTVQVSDDGCRYEIFADRRHKVVS